MSEVIVTGAAGFIGSHLVDELLGRGDRVLGIDDFDPWYPRAQKLANLGPALTNERFELLELDLCGTPVAELAARFAGAEVVFHLAARPGVQQSWGDAFVDTTQRNVVGAQRVFEASLAGGASRVVFASSSSVYGHEAGPDGARSVCPVSPYGVSKAATEQLADVYAERGLDAVGLRYFTVYGPRQRPDMAIHRMVAACTPGGSEFRVRGDGGQRREFTHVDDVVEATRRAGWAVGVGGLRLDVGGGQVARINEVAEIVGGLVGAPVRRASEPASAGDPRATVADLTVTADVLEWKPSVDLYDGLRDQVAWQLEAS